MTGNPQLTEKQETLFKQAKNCRDLAHFLRTDPRVEKHYDQNFVLARNGIYLDSSGIMDKAEFLKECNTTACGLGWGRAIWPQMTTSQYWFGASDPYDWQDLFGPSDRTAQEEALVLEAYADKLEIQI